MRRILRPAVAAAAAVAALSLLPPDAAGQNWRLPPRSPVASQIVDLESDEAQVFLHVLAAISRHSSSELADSAIWERAIAGLIEELDDPYATVFTPEQYDQFREVADRNYAGIGVQITQLGARVTVTAVFRNTPADGVGMMVGDRIVRVKGHDARDWSIDQARDSIRGEPGSVVDIGVARDGVAEPIPLSIVRDHVQVPAVIATRIDDGIVHVAIERIARGTADELGKAVEEHADASAMIMDLRGNPGGYLDEALRAADLFLAPSQVLMSAASRGASGLEEHAWRAESPPQLAETPIIVLVDRYTASAAEIIAGALQDHDRAVVLGERTLGKGVIQTHYDLPAGRRISLTTGSWYTPLGRSLHRARNRDGSPVDDEEAGPRVVTASGRELPTGGGIFPDLEEVTRFKDEELRLLNNANEVQAPMFVLMAEQALELAKKALAAGEAGRLPTAAFDALAESLVEAGMDREVVDDPVARAYLESQLELRYLFRADAIALRIAVQAERDEALAEALRLARSARTLPELFSLVDEAKAKTEASTES